MWCNDEEEQDEDLIADIEVQLGLPPHTDDGTRPPTSPSSPDTPTPPPSPPLPPVSDPDLAHHILKPHQKFLPVPTVSGRPYDPENYTRIVCISDTHGRHRRVRVPRCDVLLHAGDFTMAGEHGAVEDLGSYFGGMLAGGDGGGAAGGDGPVGEVICVAGNHDVTFQPETYAENWRTFFYRADGPMDTSVTRSLLANCTYLRDRPHVSDGVKYYGSPWTPQYGHGWAFNLPRDAIHHKWDLVPPDTDVLITHGPPLGRGDYCRSGTRAGCVDLLDRVQNRIRPRLHVFGHIHEGYGATGDGTTLFVNASSCTVDGYAPDNPCIVVDLPHDRTSPAAVVKPECTLSGAGLVELLKSRRDRNAGYGGLVPLFEGCRPPVRGEDLVADGVSWGDIGCRLGMHREEERRHELKRALRDFVMDVRTLSY